MADKKWTWENGLKVFMDTTGALTTREAVAGGGSQDWSDFGTFRIEKNVPLSKNYDTIFDFYWDFTTTYGTSSSRFVVGFSANWKGYFDEPKSPYNLFLNEPYKGLGPLVRGNSTAKTDIVNYFTFENAKTQLDGVVKWLEEWIPLIKDWGDDLDSEGSEWRGSAAGSFKKFVDVIHMEMNKVRLDITTPNNIVTLLDTAKTTLDASSWGMYRGFEAWRQGKGGGPETTTTVNGVLLLREAFNALMRGSQLEVEWTSITASYANGYTTSYSAAFKHITDNTGKDVSPPEWVRAVERTAKDNWLKSLDSLDTVATTHLSALDNAYLPLASALEEGVYQPNFTLPTGAGGGPGGPGTGGPGGGGPGGGPGIDGPPDGIGGSGEGGPGGSAGGGPGGGIKVPDVTGGKEGGTGGKGPGGLPGGPNPPITFPGSSTGSEGKGPGTGTGGGNVPLLDKNGKPVIGADGRPVMVPPGSRIGKDGKVYDSKGNPVLGTGGKQIVAPPGGKVGTPQQPGRDDTQTGGTPGAGYDRIRLPEGAKILADGSIVDAKGKPLLDSNGNPYVLPKGAVLKDGVVVDASGNPISRSHQLLTNAEHALSTRPEQKNPTIGGGKGGDGLGAGSGGSGGGRKFDLNNLGSNGAGHGGGGGPKSVTSVVGGTGGIGERVARMLGGGDGPPATASVSSDGRQSGGGTGGGTGTGAGGGAGGGTGGGTGTGGGPGTSQPPMMPPMSPGAAGGGQPNQGQDRQRTTWLTEDEDTWGTDTGSVSGVIGR
ncbi:hypothetical protein ACIRQY_17835 [Streptomyces sp. NPDC101490]|uniref:hypothetical protein n=1 Tax=Streptomyces sp. NPDC101490 TaxID=3366143 RepID=UPI003828D424